MYLNNYDGIKGIFSDDITGVTLTPSTNYFTRQRATTRIF